MRVPLRGRALLLLYRPALLSRDLRDEGTRALLRERGYAPQDLAQCLSRLAERFAGGAFPHEVGLFLGYPPEDVAGFIKHGGRGYKCCGCWKVYGDERRARRLFRRYRDCTRSVVSSHQRGMGLDGLIAAHG